MGQLNQEDWRLSMRVSPRRRDGQDAHDDLRSMLVHRLRKGYKAIMRVPMSQDLQRADHKSSILCEPCNRWVTTKGDGDIFDCACGRSYRMEFAVFTQVEGPMA